MTGSPEAGPLLEELVRAKSPSGDEEGACRVFQGALEERGLAVSRDQAGNVIARHDPGQGPSVMLLGHIDTVPGALPVRWEEDTLHGRGVVDAKGPLVAHALALERMQDEDLPARVTLAAAVGEEARSRGARHLAQTQPEPDALVIAEPTGGDAIGLGYKGRVKATLEATVQPSHPGEPSPTAPERVLEGVDALTRWTGNREREVGFDEATLRVVGLETQDGAEEETARASLDLRLPGSPPRKEELVKALPSEVTLVIEESVPAVRADPKNPVATGLRGALIERGYRPRASVKTGTSDWNVVSQAWSCPGVAFGPGDPSLDHTPNERVRIQEVEEASRVLADGVGRAVAQLRGRG